jgi:hypothetical protein
MGAACILYGRRDKNICKNPEGKRPLKISMVNGDNIKIYLKELKRGMNLVYI